MPLFLQDLPICRPHWRLYTAVVGSSFFLDAVRILLGGYSHVAVEDTYEGIAG